MKALWLRNKTRAFKTQPDDDYNRLERFDTTAGKDQGQRADLCEVLGVVEHEKSDELFFRQFRFDMGEQRSQIANRIRRKAGPEIFDCTKQDLLSRSSQSRKPMRERVCDFEMILSSHERLETHDEWNLGPPSNPSQQVTPQASAHPFPSSTPVLSRSVPLPPRDPSRLFVPCPGIPIEWDAHTFYTTYPFQLHSPNAKNCAPYDLMIVSGIPRARSPQCLGGIVTIEGIQPCAKCSRLTLDVNIIRGRAARSFEHIRDHNDLSSDQLRAKVTVVKDKVNTLRLKKLDLEVSLQRAQARLSEWIELFHFIGQNSGSIPPLHRLLGNAEKEGWSATKILEYCRLAHAGQYTARNYTQAEIDLAMLIYELGGAGAIYALNHSIFALPSRNTIQPYRRQLNLLPSVSGLRFTDIFRNITTLFGPRTRHEGEAELLPPVKCGHTVSVDEVAADRNIDLMHETDEMGGFCLEHVSKLETVKIGKDLRSVEAAVAAVKEGTVHVAQEICVAAISHLYGTDYGAKPVYMGPTCKKYDLIYR
ncbi:hypothetical protein R3P38DRAFT_3604669 [Favolaschia claudopus]|uniref:Uncharacterized protein n=1 Tax=Favolaschia claudopus TaxID=2862362 RepID=A0AAW0A8I8_9AGAR